MYDIDLMKTFSLPILVKEWDIDPWIFKEAKQHVSIKFGKIQMIDVSNYPSGVTKLFSFLEAYKVSKKKRFSPRKSSVSQAN